MHGLLTIPLCAALLFTRVAVAMPALPTVAQLLELCSSGTMTEALTRGNQLGWQRVNDDARMEEWRSGFIRHNGGAVEVVGWRRGTEEGLGLLSFWIARGASAHRACYLSVSHAPGLLRDLSETLGRPSSLDETTDIVSAAWTVGPTQVQYARTGASAVVNIARYDR